MHLWDFILTKLTKFFIPCFSVSGFSGRPERSTGAEVGRQDGRPTCTDVHALTWQLAGQPIRSTGTESSALCLFRSAGRSTGGSNGRIFDRWRSTGRSTDSSVRTPTASFFQPINLGVWSLFFQEDFGDF